jgi:hypothetical protein
MNGLSKQTWLEFFADRKVGGLLYDVFNEIHITVTEYKTNQPKACSRKFIKRTEVYIVGAVLLGIAVGVGVLDWQKILLKYLP